MAHFANIDSNGIVQQIVVVDNTIIENVSGYENEHIGAAFLNDLIGQELTWKQCSYNNNFRKQYPSLGSRYDSEFDVFILPQPFPSWSLNSNHDWEAPNPKPSDGQDYYWDESQLSWIIVPPKEI